MTDPIKLTDEVLGVIAEQIDESPIVAQWTSEQAIAAIRALRDAARAVVNAAWSEDLLQRHIVPEGYIDDLAALLPDSEVKS